jgi:cellobiose transport system substrate-binding protein
VAGSATAATHDLEGIPTMGIVLRRGARMAVVVIATAALAAAAGCSKTTEESGTDKITLTVTVFGTFGYKDAGLYDRYIQQHPKITIREQGAGQALDDENNKLNQALAAGSGAGDVVALEEGTITQYKGLAQNFVDLADYGAASLKGNFLDWKWQQGTTTDGKILGLGTDVGSMAVCYRTDLFAQAGLPTNREAVGNLWPTWDDYIAQGQAFQSKVKSAKWTDSSTNTYNNILMQTAGAGGGYTYFDRSGKLVLGSNPDVRAAWDETNKMTAAGLSAGLTSFSDDWAAGFKNSTFATVACPAWMLGVIKGDAGDGLAGKWDVAKAPGQGGNWGGSFLSVPSQSRHKTEAAELAKFLTSPDSQLAVFEKVNNLPSSPDVYANAGFQSFKNPYFNDAPVGRIFGASAQALKPVYLGAKNAPVRAAVENALRSVEQGKRTPDQAWQDALAAGASAAK